MDLEKLFKKFNSDKINHQYHKVYHSYLNSLKSKKLNILEIGVADGSSLKAWSEFFRYSKIIGIDIKDINLKKRKLLKKNIFFHRGSQSDKSFLIELKNKYNKFDIIIDDGSHYPKDVIFTFKELFNSLSINGLYFIEDTQTSYNHFFGGNPFDLKYSNTHMNYFKNLVDTINYKEIPNPFYIKGKYDGLIKNLSFYNNMIVIKKGINDVESNLVLNNSYENKRYQTKVSRNKKSKLRYFIKYKLIFKFYTFFLFLINLIKKIILLRF
jgi:hypothetical protein